MTEEKEYGFFGKWWQFAKERFDPLSHSLMIVLFIVSHYVVVAVDLGRKFPGDFIGQGAWRHPLLALGVVAFFFKLRLYDEIKDYEVDCEINRDRPLVRGLVTHQDLFRGIALCITTELISFGLLGLPALTAIVFSITYSLLMYKEFFIGEQLRPYLTTYAVMHTVVCSFLSLSLFAAIEGRFVYELHRDLLFFSINCWCLFNIFEFGRKTFNTEEERENVESYSHIFGRYGAVFLVMAMAAISGGLLVSTRLVTKGVFAPVMGACVGIMLILGALYAVLDRKPFGSIYRGMSSGYIVLVFGAVILLHLMDKL